MAGIGSVLAQPLSLLRRSPGRHLMLLALDGVIAAGSLWLAMILRFETFELPVPMPAMHRLTLALLVAQCLSNLMLRLHRWSFRLSGLADAVRVVLAGLLGTGLFVTSVFLLRLGAGAASGLGPPRSVVMLQFFIATTVMGMIRFSPRLAWLYVADRIRSRRSGAVRTLIVGAGAAGEMLLRDLQRSEEHGYQVVGFVDDNVRKIGNILGGKPVLGTIADLPALAKEHEVGQVLIAIPHVSAKRIREILVFCADLKLSFKILPFSFAYLDDHISASMLEDLQPEDLLPRAAVSFASGDQHPSARGRRTLVTGAAGSIGSEICVQLASAGAATLVMVDLNENEMYLLKRRLERRCPEVHTTCEVGDIRDRGRMNALIASHRPQDVFHAAAHKHVPLMEIAPCEAIKNNILGTRNVAQAADAHGVDRFVYISTDKAVRPTSVMGASKRVGEKIVRAAGRASLTRFCVVRFGNVLGSAGSVVPIFREQIAARAPVTVTHAEVRRFFMTLSEAVGLVLRAGYGDY
ncbi:MAG: SDR family NAD(P)-dependent oxidoreductase, partial [Acidobacteriota bacterium]